MLLPLFFGNVIHSVLEDCVSVDETLDYRELKQKYSEHRLSFDPEGNIEPSLIEAGHQIIDDFYDLNQDTEFSVYGKEVPFQFVIANFVIIGFIDRIDLVGDTIEIVDYKTGKREVAQKDISTNLQLGIYALAASKLFPDKTIKASLHYLRSGRIKSHTYSKDDLASAADSLIKKINNIINDGNFSPTRNERFCYFCDHAKSGACATGSARLKRKNGE